MKGNYSSKITKISSELDSDLNKDYSPVNRLLSLRELNHQITKLKTGNKNLLKDAVRKLGEDKPKEACEIFRKVLNYVFDKKLKVDKKELMERSFERHLGTAWASGIITYEDKEILEHLIPGRTDFDEKDFTKSYLVCKKVLEVLNNS